MTIRTLAMTTALVGFTALGAISAHAAGESDASSTPTCKTGMIYDKAQKKCVKDEETSFNDETLFDNAKALAYAGRFDEAKGLLDRIDDQDTARVQNYLGYVTRNLGDVEGGLAHYRVALTLDPDYTLARSYMGQALLLKGDRRAAMEQLDEIAARDGQTGVAYTQLAEAIVAKSLKATITY